MVTAGWVSSTSARSASSLAASALGVGWSNTSVTGNRSPVVALSLLRSSTEVRESNPSSLNALPPGTESVPSWPSTVAVCPRTRSTRNRSRSVGFIAASLSVSVEAPACTVCTTRRAGVRTRPRSSGELSPVADRSAATSSRTGTSAAFSAALPASNSFRPSSVDSAAMPERVILATSASSRWAVMPPRWAQNPHASEVAGRPAALRCWASPSRKALAAA